MKKLNLSVCFVGEDYFNFYTGQLNSTQDYKNIYEVWNIMKYGIHL